MLGHCHDLNATRMRLLFVQIYAHNYSSCAFQLHIIGTYVLVGRQKINKKHRVYGSKKTLRKALSQARGLCKFR